MDRTSLFGYTYAKYEEKIKEQESKPNLKEFQNSFLTNLGCLPNFPNMNLILELSFEKYERNPCKVNLVFLPYETLYINAKSDTLIFSYENKKMSFEKENIRLIRKISESSNEEYAVVLCCDKLGIYYFRGIINISKIDEAFLDYYFIEIYGYSNWSAKCKKFSLFDFKNGNFCEHKKDDYDFKIQVQAVVDYFNSCSFSINEELLKIILKTINDQKHGTSFIIFKDENKAKEEAKRLSGAQRGFMAENPLKYKEFVECIPQFTKVDGGLLLDSNLTCYGYGFIFDGLVPKQFKGSLANGSRFNSTALYTYNLNDKIADITTTSESKQQCECHKSTICVGVVFSDDGGVKIATV